MLLVGDTLSLEIIRIVSGSKVSCAVAFWGHGSETIFGSVDLSHVKIVCNLRMGGTNPLAIMAIQAKGAHVRHMDNLHAKVYIGDIDAVVASANASVNGLGILAGTSATWLEAGVVLPSADAVDWFETLWKNSHAVQPSDLTAGFVAFSKQHAVSSTENLDGEAEFAASLLTMSVRRATHAILEHSRTPMTTNQIAKVLISVGFETVSTRQRAVYEALRAGLGSVFALLPEHLWALSSWSEYSGYSLTDAQTARLTRVRRVKTDTDPILSERVKAALEAAKRRGVPQGAALKVTPERLQQIRDMFASGVTYTRIASELGLSEPTIKRALRRAGFVGFALQVELIRMSFCKAKSQKLQAFGSRIPICIIRWFMHNRTALIYWADTACSIELSGPLLPEPQDLNSRRYLINVADALTWSSY